MMRTFTSTIEDQKSNIVEVYFINDTQSSIDNRYNNAMIKVDLTYNSYGSVKGWLEPTVDDSSKYILYIGSTGTIYLCSGSYMFNGFSNATIIDLSNVDISQVTDMGGMFSDCSGLTSLDVSKFDTSQVINMSSMFSGCSGLTELDLSKFDTSKVTDMSFMFSDCSGLTSLDVSKFDTSKVTDMSSMFYNCYGLYSERNNVYKVNTFNFVKVLFDFLAMSNDYSNWVYYNGDGSVKKSGEKLVYSDYVMADDVRYDIIYNGDVNGDGTLSLSDIMKIANYIYKDSSSLTKQYKYAADFNNDYEYSLVDIMLLANKMYKEV